MDIKYHEIKKIVLSPIVLALTVVFIAFNLFVIYDNSYISNDLKIINNIIDEFGYKIDDSMVDNINASYKSKLEEFNKITKDKLGKTYSSMEEFLDSEYHYTDIYDSDLFTKEELNFFDEINILELYLFLVTEQVNSYESIDILKVKDFEIKSFGISGEAKEIAEKRYEILNKRFEEIKENKEHKNLFFYGKAYRTHNLLFDNIFSKCIYEIMILVVLITVYLINYEFDNNTSLLVYSTKRGRNNTKDKFIVCLFSAIIISIIILGITLLAYFLVFDYSKVLNVPINSAFNWEYPMPYINLFENTVIQQIILSIIVVLLCSLIFAAITFIISKLVKNSYIVFFIFFIVFGINIMIPTLAGKSSALTMYLHFDVFNLILNPSMWFMSKVPFTVTKYHEVITIFAWMLITLVGSICCVKIFKKQDIN